MERRPLGATGLQVSAWCLGTMSFGAQTDPVDASAQLDLAVAAGINFIDTAEAYPAPSRAETYGRTEMLLGQWLHARGGRDHLVLASKCAGPAAWAAHIRDGQTRFDRTTLDTALTQSLRRLQTDYLDLYYLHWPERAANFFGQLGYKPARNERPFLLEDTVAALSDFVVAGKIRAFGVCNETAWGVMRYLAIAGPAGPARIGALQMPYNLLNRTVEIALAEIADRERVPIVAYSPLAMGILTGKYLADRGTGRLRRDRHYRRLLTPEVQAATRAYAELAARHDMDPVQMALAFVQSNPMVTSCIIGASTVDQLAGNLAYAGASLPPGLRAAIDAIHRCHPNPCP